VWKISYLLGKSRICFNLLFYLKKNSGWNILRRSVMFQIETGGVLNGHLVFPEHVRMNIKNIECVYHPRRLVSKFQVLWIYKVKLKGLIVTQWKLIICQKVNK
jgi:hypothetical protein